MEREAMRRMTGLGLVLLLSSVLIQQVQLTRLRTHVAGLRTYARLTTAWFADEQALLLEAMGHDTPCVIPARPLEYRPGRWAWSPWRRR